MVCWRRYLCKDNDQTSPCLDRSRDSVTSSVDLDESSYRPRSTLTDAQRRILEEAYARDPWPSRTHLQELTRLTEGLSRRVIQVWFQNCRARDRRKGRCIPERPGGTRPGAFTCLPIVGIVSIDISSSTGGSVVECSPATRAARVRFPASALIFFVFQLEKSRQRKLCRLFYLFKTASCTSFFAA